MTEETQDDNPDYVIDGRNLTKVYTMGDNEVRALDGVDVQIKRGELLSIMGPSGSGKSTLMAILGCLDSPTSGEYHLDGEPVHALGDNALAGIRSKQLGFVFQQFNLLPRTPAIEQVSMPMIYAGIRGRKRKQRAQEMLELVGLGERMDHTPAELSGGQQQRVAIARSLANDPAILLADEPTGALDTKTGIEIMALFKRLNREEGITVIIVTHDVEVAEQTPRVIHIRDGLIEKDVINETVVDIDPNNIPAH